MQRALQTEFLQIIHSLKNVVIKNKTVTLYAGKLRKAREEQQVAEKKKKKVLQKTIQKLTKGLSAARRKTAKAAILARAAADASPTSGESLAASPVGSSNDLTTSRMPFTKKLREAVGSSEFKLLSSEEAGTDPASSEDIFVQEQKKSMPSVISCDSVMALSPSYGSRASSFMRDDSLNTSINTIYPGMSIELDPVDLVEARQRQKQLGDKTDVSPPLDYDSGGVGLHPQDGYAADVSASLHQQGGLAADVSPPATDGALVATTPSVIEQSRQHVTVQPDIPLATDAFECAADSTAQGMGILDSVNFGPCGAGNVPFRGMASGQQKQ